MNYITINVNTIDWGEEWESKLKSLLDWAFSELVDMQPGQKVECKHIDYGETNAVIIASREKPIGENK